MIFPENYDYFHFCSFLCTKEETSTAVECDIIVANNNYDLQLYRIPWLYDVDLPPNEVECTDYYTADQWIKLLPKQKGLFKLTPTLLLFLFYVYMHNYVHYF